VFVHIIELHNFKTIYKLVDLEKIENKIKYSKYYVTINHILWKCQLHQPMGVSLCLDIRNKIVYPSIFMQSSVIKGKND
jgi:hypothetical protein